MQSSSARGAMPGRRSRGCVRSDLRCGCCESTVAGSARGVAGRAAASSVDSPVWTSELERRPGRRSSSPYPSSVTNATARSAAFRSAARRERGTDRVGSGVEENMCSQSYGASRTERLFVFLGWGVRQRSCGFPARPMQPVLHGGPRRSHRAGASAGRRGRGARAQAPCVASCGGHTAITRHAPRRRGRRGVSARYGVGASVGRTRIAGPTGRRLARATRQAARGVRSTAATRCCRARTRPRSWSGRAARRPK